MHEPVNYDYVWLFLIGGIILCGALFIVSPKLMSFLDKWGDERNQKTEELKKNIRKK
ncbi:MAG TPA: hypothetical protein PKE69_22985 [Pyrinomonadaceae bacterium]|nr:hypothetical protein [Pyrinomonadaceae bacterium]